jgi:hypothetical protein
MSKDRIITYLKIDAVCRSFTNRGFLEEYIDHVYLTHFEYQRELDKQITASLVLQRKFDCKGTAFV